MNKKIKTIQKDDDIILHKVRIEDKKHDILSADSLKEQLRYAFIQTIMGTPELWQCGPGKFDKMSIFFENGGWIAELDYEERLFLDDGTK